MIDTSANANGQQAQGNADAPAVHKERMKEAVDKFMGQRDVTKRIEKLIGKQGNRLPVSLDELRMFDEELANYVMKNPIESLNMFETQLDGHIKDLRDDGGKPGASEK